MEGEEEGRKVGPRLSERLEDCLSLEGESEAQRYVPGTGVQPVLGKEH